MRVKERAAAFMALFLSKFVNKVDKKGRVSVPAGFRTALAEQKFHGVVLFCSSAHACLEGFGWNTMEEISNRMDHYDLFSDDQDDLATAVFGEAVQLPFDKEGRMILTADLMAHAAIEEQAVFVGMGRKFQVWNPQAFEQRRAQARQAVKKKGLTLPKGESS